MSQDEPKSSTAAGVVFAIIVLLILVSVVTVRATPSHAPQPHSPAGVQPCPAASSRVQGRAGQGEPRRVGARRTRAHGEAARAVLAQVFLDSMPDLSDDQKMALDVAELVRSLVESAVRPA